jgi:hypothetical protein
MEAFYNKEKNQYIFAAYRCGTNFLNSKPVRNQGWVKIDYYNDKLNIDNNTQIIKIIRDPYQRWVSWFDHFVLANSKSNWNILYAREWLKEFEATLHLDFHTEKQSVLYNRETINVSQSIYVNMEDLNIFLKVSNQRHVINYRDRFENLPKNSRKLFLFKIKKIYQDDYKWIKSLPIKNF